MARKPSAQTASPKIVRPDVEDEPEGAGGPLDLRASPIFVALDVTDKSRITRYFQGVDEEGRDAQEQAEAWAGKRAANTGRDVAIFGPQAAIFEPPAPVTVGTKVPLRFGRAPTVEGEE